MRLYVNRIIFIALLILCLVILIGYSNKDSKQRITLIDAFQRLEVNALEWSSDAELVHITSVDDPETKDNGYDGKRLFWRVTFHSVTLNESIVLSIKDNKISTDVIAPEKLNSADIINKTNNILNSDSALKSAKKDYNLQPGTMWAKGYNYTLYKQNEQTVLCVYGEDINGYFTKISYDFYSGQCLFAEHQIPVGGGFWNSTISLINDVWVTGADFSPNYDRDSTIAIQCIENPLTPKSASKLKISTDSGLTWVDYLFDEQILKVKFSEKYDSNKSLFVTTANSFYKLVDNQLHKVKLFNKVIDTDIKEDKIIVLTKEKIYFSDDAGVNWGETQVPDGNLLSVKGGEGDNIYLRKSPNDILQLKNNIWENINQPLSSLYNYDVINDKIMEYIDDKIAIFDSITSKWSVLDSPVIVNTIYYSGNSIFVIGSKNIYTLSLYDNIFKEYNVGPPFSNGEINSYFHTNQEDFFIETFNSSWEEIK
jgi:hypothetical protein